MPIHRKPERRGSWLRRAATLIVLSTLTNACGGGSTESKTHTEVGTYHLLTVNGQSLPVTITNTALGTVVIQSATVVLTSASASTYTASITGTAGGAPSTTIVSDAGSYVRSGTTITFTSSSAPVSFAGTVNDSNGHLTVALPGAAIGAAITTSLQLELAK